MIKNTKTYFGQHPNEEVAARMYDLINIQLKGLEAKTNFEYTKSFLLSLLFENSFIEIKK